MRAVDVLPIDRLRRFAATRSQGTIRRVVLDDADTVVKLEGPSWDGLTPAQRNLGAAWMRERRVYRVRDLDHLIESYIATGRKPPAMKRPRSSSDPDEPLPKRRRLSPGEELSSVVEALWAAVQSWQSDAQKDGESLAEAVSKALQKPWEALRLQSGTGGDNATKVALEVTFRRVKGVIAVTFPQREKVVIFLNRPALLSAKKQGQVLVSSVLHEFVHALQNSQMPDELKDGSKKDDAWIYNAETVDAVEREALLTLPPPRRGRGTEEDRREAVFVRVRDDAENKVTKAPAYALSQALREIEAHSIELEYAMQTGIDDLEVKEPGDETPYLTRTVMDMNDYVRIANRALDELNRRGEAQILTYWAGYLEKSVDRAKRALVDLKSDLEITELVTEPTPASATSPRRGSGSRSPSPTPGAGFTLSSSSTPNPRH